MEIGSREKNLYRASSCFPRKGEKGEGKKCRQQQLVKIRRAFLRDSMLKSADGGGHRDEGGEADGFDSLGSDSEKRSGKSSEKQKWRKEEAPSMHSDVAMEGPVVRELGW